MHYGLVSGPGKIPCQELSVSVRLGCESRRARGNVEGGQRVLFSPLPTVAPPPRFASHSRHSNDGRRGGRDVFQT